MLEIEARGWLLSLRRRKDASAARIIRSTAPHFGTHPSGRGGTVTFCATLLFPGLWLSDTFAFAETLAAFVLLVGKTFVVDFFEAVAFLAFISFCRLGKWRRVNMSVTVRKLVQSSQHSEPWTTVPFSAWAGSAVTTRSEELLQIPVMLAHTSVLLLNLCGQKVTVELHLTIVSTLDLLHHVATLIGRNDASFVGVATIPSLQSSSTDSCHERVPYRAPLKIKSKT
jgi:hypothetical protein